MAVHFNHPFEFHNSPPHSGEQMWDFLQVIYITPTQIFLPLLNTPQSSNTPPFDIMEKTIGLLGGGQLGQMLCEAANPLGVKVIILDAPNSPAKQVNAKNDHLDGSFIDAEKIRELAKKVDVLTVEIEHVDTYVLEELANSGVEVQPSGYSF